MPPVQKTMEPQIPGFSTCFFSEESYFGSQDVLGFRKKFGTFLFYILGSLFVIGSFHHHFSRFVVVQFGCLNTPVPNHLLPTMNELRVFATATIASSWQLLLDIFRVNISPLPLFFAEQHCIMLRLGATIVEHMSLRYSLTNPKEW